jgi:hypothetical protein
MTSLEEAREKIADKFMVQCSNSKDFECSHTQSCKHEDRDICAWQLDAADLILDLPLVSGLSIRQLCEMGNEELLTDEEISQRVQQDAKKWESIHPDFLMDIAHIVARAQLLKCKSFQAAHDAQVRRETAGVLNEMIQAFRDYEMNVDEEPPTSHWRMMERAVALRDKYLKGE